MRTRPPSETCFLPRGQEEEYRLVFGGLETGEAKVTGLGGLRTGETKETRLGELGGDREKGPLIGNSLEIGAGVVSSLYPLLAAPFLVL